MELCALGNLRLEEGVMFVQRNRLYASTTTHRTYSLLNYLSGFCNTVFFYLIFRWENKWVGGLCNELRRVQVKSSFFVLVEMGQVCLNPFLSKKILKISGKKAPKFLFLFIIISVSNVITKLYYFSN